MTSNYPVFLTLTYQVYPHLELDDTEYVKMYENKKCLSDSTGSRVVITHSIQNFAGHVEKWTSGQLFPKKKGSGK